MYSEIIEFLSRNFPRSVASVPGGGIYYVTDKGELAYSSALSLEEGEVLVSPADERELERVWDVLHHPDTCAALEKETKQVKATFTITDDLLVCSELEGVDKEPVQIGRVLCGDDKETGATLVILAGSGGNTVAVLTAVSDASGNVSPAFVEDLMAFSDAIAQMADILSRRYFNKPVVPSYEEFIEPADSAVFSEQRHPQA